MNEEATKEMLTARGNEMSREELIEVLVGRISGELGNDQLHHEMAAEAFDMGAEYAGTHRFNNSGKYHNYDYLLDDGTVVKAFNYFDIFTTRLQTQAFMDAETAVREYFDDPGDRLFHLVRDQRFGINGAYKAILSPRESQNLNFTDYVLIVACFCAGWRKGQK